MKRHFTIIELLLVLGISAIMLSIAVPAFYKTMRGSAPGLAAREIMGKINAARAYATSNRVDVAIVFPQNETNVPASLQFSSYRVCEVIVDSSNNFTFKRWIPGENWNFFPKGVVIGWWKNKKTNALESEKFAAPDSADEKNVAQRPVTVDGVEKQEDCFSYQTVSSFADTRFGNNSVTLQNCIVIRRDGMLQGLAGVLIKIRQARVESGSVVLTPPYEKDYLPLVVRFNGKVKAFREVVTE